MCGICIFFSQDNLVTGLTPPFLFPFSAHLLLKAGNTQAVQLFYKHRTDVEDVTLMTWPMHYIAALNA